MCVTYSCVLRIHACYVFMNLCTVYVTYHISDVSYNFLIHLVSGVSYVLRFLYQMYLVLPKGVGLSDISCV